MNSSKYKQYYDKTPVGMSLRIILWIVVALIKHQVKWILSLKVLFISFYRSFFKWVNEFDLFLFMLINPIKAGVELV